MHTTMRMNAAGRLAGILSRTLAAGAVTLAVSFAMPALAQDDAMTPIAIPAQPDAIVLNTGALPGATVAESWHRQYGSVFARNVTIRSCPIRPRPAARRSSSPPAAASVRCR
jgi:hypothetical protein